MKQKGLIIEDGRIITIDCVRDEVIIRIEQSANASRAQMDINVAIEPATIPRLIRSLYQAHQQATGKVIPGQPLVDFCKRIKLHDGDNETALLSEVAQDLATMASLRLRDNVDLQKALTFAGVVEIKVEICQLSKRDATSIREQGEPPRPAPNSGNHDRQAGQINVVIDLAPGLRDIVASIVSALKSDMKANFPKTI